MSESRFIRVLLRFSKLLNDVASFTAELSQDLYNVQSIEVEEVIVAGVTNTGGVPDTRLIAVDLDINGLSSATVTNDSEVSGIVIPIAAAPYSRVAYDNPSTRRLRELSTAQGSKVRRRFKVDITDETLGAADRTRPQFTEISIVLRCNFQPANPATRLLAHGDRYTTESLTVIDEAGSRTRGYRMAL